VDGVLTCDPNIYSGAEPVPYLTFDEAAELAYFGAQVYAISQFNIFFVCNFTILQFYNLI